MLNTSIILHEERCNSSNRLEEIIMIRTTQLEILQPTLRQMMQLIDERSGLHLKPGQGIRHPSDLPWADSIDPDGISDYLIENQWLSYPPEYVTWITNLHALATYDKAHPPDHLCAESRHFQPLEVILPGFLSGKMQQHRGGTSIDLYLPERVPQQLVSYALRHYLNAGGPNPYEDRMVFDSQGCDLFRTVEHIPALQPVVQIHGKTLQLSHGKCLDDAIVPDYRDVRANHYLPLLFLRPSERKEVAQLIQTALIENESSRPRDLTLRDLLEDMVPRCMHDSSYRGVALPDFERSHELCRYAQHLMGQPIVDATVHQYS